MGICLDIIPSTGVDLTEPLEGIVRENEAGGGIVVPRERVCKGNKVNPGLIQGSRGRHNLPESACVSDRHLCICCELSW